MLLIYYRVLDRLEKRLNIESQTLVIAAVAAKLRGCKLRKVWKIDICAEQLLRLSRAHGGLSVRLR
jgi:hypothetical protein